MARLRITARCEASLADLGVEAAAAIILASPRPKTHSEAMLLYDTSVGQGLRFARSLPGCRKYRPFTLVEG